uniref:CHZ domain-containing protein n=1 Tax=Steinernema glaseri TaxID=37863 RepID=A0A1I7ZK80_9BILA
MGSSPATSAGKRRTPPGSIRKRTRNNDEYTSITDTIAVSVKVPAAQKVRPSATEVDLMYDDDEEEDEEIHIQAKVIMGNVNDTTINTEDDDDEEISRDGDDEDDVSSGGGRRRSGSTYLGGTLTPNSALRRAKPSFVEKQNSVMRECEEEINTRIREHRLGSTNSEELHTNTPIECEVSPHGGHDSEEYLQFKIDSRRRKDQ